MPKNKRIIKISNTVLAALAPLKLIQHKAVLSIISKVEDTDEDGKLYKLSVRELSKGMGVAFHGGSDWKRVLDTVSSLVNTPIRIESINPKGRIRREYFCWASYAKHVEGTDVIEVRFCTALFHYLVKVKGDFTLIGQDHIKKLNTKHSLCLYYQGVMNSFKADSNSTFLLQYSILEVREALGIEGDVAYTLFKNINNRALIPAITKINGANTDIQVHDLQHKKEGKKVSGIVMYCKLIETEEQKNRRLGKQPGHITREPGQSTKRRILPS